MEIKMINNCDNSMTWKLVGYRIKSTVPFHWLLANYILPYKANNEEMDSETRARREKVYQVPKNILHSTVRSLEIWEKT